MRRNPFVRVRRYGQRPQPMWSWAEVPDGDPAGLVFCDAANPFYARDMRMQSWRRPI